MKISRKLLAVLLCAPLVTVSLGATLPAAAADPTGLTPSPSTLTSLPLTKGGAGSVTNVQINFQFVGGDSSYTCATDETLPSGLSLGSDCVLDGETDTVEDVTFTIDVTDTNTSTVVLSEEYTISVEAYSLQNSALRFGSGGNHSVAPTGSLQQPWYYSEADSQWYPLIYDDPTGYSVDLGLGFGDGGSAWNDNDRIYDLTDDRVEVIGNDAFQIIGWSVDTSGFTQTGTSSGVKEGYGTIVSETTFLTANDNYTFIVKNTYSLGQSDSFVKGETSVKQMTGSDWNNVYLWVGTRDDYVGSDDGPTNTKGNITGSGFSATTGTTDLANAVQTTSADEGALFYSTASGANSIIDSCCSWEDILVNDPTASGLEETSDNAYGVAVPLGTLVSDSFSQASVWYFAGGATASLSGVYTQVAQSSGAAPAAPAPYTGVLPVSVSDPEPVTGQKVTVSGFRFGGIISATIDGLDASVESITATSCVITIPSGLTPGLKDIVFSTSTGKLIYQDALTVIASSQGGSNQKVNAGSFKGYVAVYAKGYEGHRLSAKVGKDWVIVPSIPASANDLFRYVEFTGAGVDIAVRIYIDRVLMDTINLTTK